MKMYIFIIPFFAIQILCVYNVNGQSTKLDIKGMIENTLAELKEKIPEVFNFSNLTISFPPNKYIVGTLDLWNVSLSGVKAINHTISYGFFSIPQKYDFTIQNLSLVLDYKSNISLFDSLYFELFGEGTSSITLNNLTVGGDISTTLLPMNASTNADVNLDAVTVNVTGLLSDDSFSKQFGTVVGKSLYAIFQGVRGMVSRLLTSTLNYAIQLILSKHNMSQDHPQNNQEFEEEDDIFK